VEHRFESETHRHDQASSSRIAVQVQSSGRWRRQQSSGTPRKVQPQRARKAQSELQQWYSTTAARAQRHQRLSSYSLRLPVMSPICMLTYRTASTACVARSSALYCSHSQNVRSRNCCIWIGGFFFKIVGSVGLAQLVSAAHWCSTTAAQRHRSEIE